MTGLGHPTRFAAPDRQSLWLAIISGERRGPAATLARAGLSILSLLYRAGLAVGNLRFRLPGGVQSAGLPVVSVGNLSVGGTGKTPMVALIARLATEAGARPLIVSRGYGATVGGANEEARELERLCPGVPHVQNPDRLRAIAEYYSDSARRVSAPAAKTDGDAAGTETRRAGEAETHPTFPSVTLSRPEGPCEGSRRGRGLGDGQRQQPQRDSSASLREGRNDNVEKMPNLVILDDGYQHRRVARDLNIVLIDALRPFGCGAGDFGCTLPRGILREPLSALERADLAVITRAELVDAAALTRIKQSLARRLRPGVPVLVAEHRPTGLRMLDGSRRPVDWLRGQDVAAACGIGNPEAFRGTLQSLGARVRLFETFRDHHAYTAADLVRLLSAADAAGVKVLVTTGKDYVKWQPLLAGRGPLAVDVAAVEVALSLVEGEDELRRRVAALVKH